MSPLRTAVLAAVTALGVAWSSPAGAVSADLTQVVSDDPSNSTPHALDGTVRAIAEIGGKVYVGGTFTAVTNPSGGAQITRRHLFAYDPTTGQVDTSFAPALNGPVETIAAGPGGTVLIGGRFTTVSGVSQRSLAMLNAATGQRVTSFGASTNGYVTKILVRGSRLLAGGRFGKANNQSRQNLAAFDATTGALDGLNLPVTVGRTKSDGRTTKPAVQEMDADLAGDRLVIVGNFRQVAGQQRQQIAMIDLTSNQLASWFTNRYPNGSDFECYQVFDTVMRDVEFSPGGDYFAVVTTGGAPDFNAVSLCDTVTRWETAAAVPVGGAQPTWRNCTGGDTLYSVSVTRAAIYVGGHQRWMDNCGGRDFAVQGSVSRNGIAAVDPVSGKALAWNPGRTRGVGAEELVATPRGLYVGSDTERLGGEYHGRYGLFPAR